MAMNPAQLSKETERDSTASVLTLFPAAGSTLSVGSSTSPLVPTTDRSSSLESKAGRSPGSGTSTPIDIDVLYRAREARSSHFSSALELLARASGILDSARQAVHEGNPLESDNQFLQFQALLPKLFECRTIGEGFANIINAIQIGIANLNGQPLDAVQLNAV